MARILSRMAGWAPAVAAILVRAGHNRVFVPHGLLFVCRSYPSLSDRVGERVGRKCYLQGERCAFDNSGGPKWTAFEPSRGGQATGGCEFLRTRPVLKQSAHAAVTSHQARRQDSNLRPPVS